VTSDFGRLLGRLRQQAGMTQEELAERSGVAVRTIRNVETSATANPRLRTVRLLADALADAAGMTPDATRQLLGGGTVLSGGTVLGSSTVLSGGTVLGSGTGLGSGGRDGTDGAPGAVNSLRDSSQRYSSIAYNGLVNLKEWAAREGISYSTARRWLASGTLPVAARKVGGLILVEDKTLAPLGITAVYARVSSADHKPDLDRQVARVTAWAADRGLSVGRVVTEVGPALGGKRRKFLALLRDPSVSVIAVERRDRLARFGAEYVEAALAATGRQLLVSDPSEADDDLVRDVTEILTSLCARLYGRRAAADRAARAIAALGQAGPA
jgi:predicted site-specific integrase-resolvase/DNA-binding XRE family transcriptional regulator